LHLGVAAGQPQGYENSLGETRPCIRQTLFRIEEE
jgi:hypothetical protein